MKKILLNINLLFCLTLTFTSVWSQTANQKAKMIIGMCDRNLLKSNAQFSPAYIQNYTEYQADNSKIDSLRKTLTGLKIHIVFGSWCGDSKSQVPRFLKIMDVLQFPADNITYEGVDYGKTTSKPLNIEKVPTFIFYKDGKEIYRLIEKPQISLESDILAHIK